MGSHPDSGRAFASDTLETFDFLTRDYGFDPTHAGPWRVRYESREAFVEIERDRESGEVDFSVGLLREDKRRERSFTIRQILFFLDGRSAEWTPFFRSDERLADLVRRSADEALRADREFFGRMEELESRRLIERVREIEADWAGREFLWGI